MTDRVKVFEEKKSGLPIWAWLLPLLLLLALLAYYLMHRTNDAAPVANSTTAQPAAAYPDLGVVHFDTDKATLTPEGQATLTRAADAMKANPKAHMWLEGFTDSTGSAPHNLSLSEQRAQTVGEFLKAKGIDGSRLTGDGFGEAKPVDTNATAAGKADNRRVELFTQQ